VLQDQNTKEVYEMERRNCRHILQKEKRNFLNGLLEEAERNHLQGNSRSFFRIIKKHQQLNPSLKEIRNKEGFILMEPGKKAERWREYFIELLNSDIPANPVGKTIYQKSEPSINDIMQEEVDRAIDSLKNWKAPGSDNIQAEVIKYGGKRNTVLHV